MAVDTGMCCSALCARAAWGPPGGGCVVMSITGAWVGGWEGAMPDCTWAWDKEQGRQETPPLSGDPQGPPSPPQGSCCLSWFKEESRSRLAKGCRLPIWVVRGPEGLLRFPPSRRTPVCARTLGTGQNGLRGPKPYDRHARQVPQIQRGKGLWGRPVQTKVGGSPPSQEQPRRGGSRARAGRGGATWGMWAMWGGLV